MIFSIIMPVYNAEKTLDKTIQSVLQQTTKDFEFIIVDDGSCDESHKIVSQYAQEDGRVKIICQDNAGPGIARNNGISQSEGDYIAFIDADDYWEKDFLETIIRCSDNNKADLIFVEAVTEYPNGDIANYLNIKKNAGAARERMLSNQMTGKLPWGMFKVIRRDAHGRKKQNHANCFLCNFQFQKVITSAHCIDSIKICCMNRPEHICDTKNLKIRHTW